jgi:transposase-like protein
MALMTVNNEETGDFRSKPRWSANRKLDVVLRLLRGEKLVEAHRLAAWRDEFLDAGKEGLKGKTASGEPDDRALRQAERKIGELTMDNEILRAIARKRGLQIPPQKRPR